LHRRITASGRRADASSLYPRVHPEVWVRRFPLPPDVIILAVRWYLRYGLSYRDMEKLLAERGIAVDHVTVYRWVQRFTPLLIEVARPCRHAAGDRWYVDETWELTCCSTTKTFPAKACTPPEHGI
jgi:hypothetical protein